MNSSSLSLTLTVSDGDRTRTLPALALAAALRLPPREVCAVLRFLLDPDDHGPQEPHPAPLAPFDGEGGRGMGKRSEGSVTLEKIYISERFTFGGGLGEPERIARLIAETLGDGESIGGFKKLARVHPEPLLLEALRRTLEIPAARITRSRGACFMGVVRRLAAAGWAAPAMRT